MMKFKICYDCDKIKWIYQFRSDYNFHTGEIYCSNICKKCESKKKIL